MKTFVLIGSENLEHGEIARDIVARAGFESTPQPVVTLDLVADRASQFRADAVVVFLTDHIEQGQRAIQTVKQVCNTHLLAVGPARDPQLILRTMQMGADEYLDESVWNHQLSEALVRFKARGQAHLRPQQPCRTIGVLAPSGGSGSSTLAVNIAVALSQNHGSSLLLDLRLLFRVDFGLAVARGIFCSATTRPRASSSEPPVSGLKRATIFWFGASRKRVSGTKGVWSSSASSGNCTRGRRPFSICAQIGRAHV